VPVAQLLQPLANLDEARVALVPVQAGDDLDFDLLGLLRVGIVQELGQHVGVHHQRLQVIAHRLDVDVIEEVADEVFDAIGFVEHWPSSSS
jgi:hypothetical protein